MWHVRELKLHAEERIKIEKAKELEGKKGTDEKRKHGLCNATHVRQSVRDVWMI